MADSLQFPWSGHTMADDTGAAYSGGVFRIYDAGTTDPRSVYSTKEVLDGDVAGTTITTDADGIVPMRFLRTGAYKVTFETAAAVQIFSYDNLPGALDTSGFGTTYAFREEPAISVTATSYTLLAANLGKVHDCNPSGGDIAFTLLDAVTAGDGAVAIIRHVGSSGNVAISAPSSQISPITLTRIGQSVTVNSNGATWRISAEAAGLFLNRTPIINLVDRQTAPPSSPAAGSRYLINGTPTGAWASFAANDIVEYHAVAGWQRYTPARGWIGYLEDDQFLVSYNGTTWVDWSNFTAPTSSALKTAVFEDQKATNTGGGTPTANQWLTVTINTQVSNSITGLSLSSNRLAIPVGNYNWNSSKSFYGTDNSRTRIFQIKKEGTVTITNASPGVVTLSAHGLSVNDEVILSTSGSLPTGLTAGVSYFVQSVPTADTFTLSATEGGAAINTSSAGSGTHSAVCGDALAYSANLSLNSSVNPGAGVSVIDTILTVASAITVELQYRVSNAAANGLGVVHNVTGFVERYCQVTILDRASIQGPQGVAGAAATPGKQTLWIPAAAMTPRVTNGAAFGITEHPTNDVMISTLDFDQTTEEGVGFSIAFPKGWDEGTVTFQPFWTAASGSGGVVFGLAGIAISNDEVLDVAVSGQQTSTDTLIATGDLHVGPASSAITIGGTPAVDDLCYFEITREVANGSDTLSGDARLIGVKLFYTNNTYTDE